MFNRVLEITFILILVFLVVNNASGFSQVVRSAGSVYTSSIRVLQGR